MLFSTNSINYPQEYLPLSYIFNILLKAIKIYNPEGSMEISFKNQAINKDN